MKVCSFIKPESSLPLGAGLKDGTEGPVPAESPDPALCDAPAVARAAGETGWESLGQGWMPASTFPSASRGVALWTELVWAGSRRFYYFLF